MSSPHASRDPSAVTETKERTGTGGLEGGGGTGRGLGLLVSCASRASLVALHGDELFVGRSPDCDVVLDDASVSRRHARLRVGERITVEDLGSHNGTTVQGRRLRAGEEVPLTVGTVFELGSATLVLQRRGAFPAPESTAPEPPRAAQGATASRSPAPIVVDPTMRNLYALVDVIAPTALSVVILGETGVGKELYAEAVHARSQRRAKPFLRLNCAALPASLLEGELFGYERGAFTGAAQAKVGLFESADGGTILLDEIGEVPLATQSKLLRVLENGEVLRLGSTRPRHVDVRFISATNRDPRQLVAEGAFRADLYFRLDGVSITLPPLRMRRGEIAPLARSFVSRAAARAGREPPALSDRAVAALERHSWPGNVRELRNVIERAVVLCKGRVLDAEGLSLSREEASSGGASPHVASDPPLPRGAIAEDAVEPAATDGLRGELRAIEKARILDALAQTGGNQSRAAKLLGMSRYTLMARIEAYGLSRPRKGS